MDEAISYAQRGWSVLPLHNVDSEGRCSCGDTEKEHARGKHPRVKGWAEQDPASVADVVTWWEKWPEANVGLATGQASGFFVLDIDPKHDGDKRLAELIAENGPLPVTYTVSTGSGGTHYYFLMPDFEVTNSPGRLPKGIDVRGTGGQVVAAGSKTDLGTYEVATDLDIAEAPSWLLEMVRPTEVVVAEAGSDRELSDYVRSALEAEVQAVRDSGDGERNNQLNRSTFSLATMVPHEVIDEETITKAMTIAGEAVGLDSKEVSATIASGLKGGKAKPRAPWPPPEPGGGMFLPFTGGGRSWERRSWDDRGNAERFVDRYGSRIRWVPTANRWVTYADGRWMMDERESAARGAWSTIISLPSTEALEYDDQPGVDDQGNPTPPEREGFLKWVGKQRYTARIKAMLEAIKGFDEMQVSVVDFDTDPMLLNTTNGIVDLTTGELHAHDPNLLMMQQTSVAYDADADMTEWLRFLDRVMPDKGMQAYLQRVAGYTLTAQTDEQAMFVHYGSGANGKSVFLDVLSSVLGDYAQAVPRKTLLRKGNEDGVPNDVARMLGKRLLLASETEIGRHLDEEAIKSLTGGDKVTARFMRAEFFDFVPTGKIHLMTNHLPQLSGAPSLRRRLHLFEWKVVIPDAEQVAGLSRLLAGEGVLRWLVEGVLAWQEHGLAPPVEATEAVDLWMEDEDEFGAFVRECLVAAPGHQEPIGSIYEEYQFWAARNGVRLVWTKRAVSRALAERGFERWRSKNDRGFSGIRSRRTLAVE